MAVAFTVAVVTSLAFSLSDGRITATRYRSPETPDGSNRQAVASYVALLPGSISTVVRTLHSTEMFCEPETALTVAVMAAVPSPTPLASPLLLTVATDEFAVDQVTIALLTVLPLESRMAAENTCVTPTGIVTPDGETGHGGDRRRS